MNDDLLIQRHLPYVRVRVERIIKFTSGDTQDEYKALGGDSFQSYGIDPDATLADACTQVIRTWANSSEGILGYIAQWGFMERESAVIHHIKVFVNGELAWEGDVIA